MSRSYTSGLKFMQIELAAFIIRFTGNVDCIMNSELLGNNSGKCESG